MTRFPLVAIAVAIVLSPAFAMAQSLPPLGIVQGACVSIAQSNLAAGTPVTLVVTSNGGAPVVTSSTITADAATADNCGMLKDGRYVDFGEDATEFYMLSAGTAEPTDIGLAVLGAVTATSGDGGVALDLGGTKVLLTTCTTSEALQLAAWPGAAFDGLPTWEVHYGLGYDVEPTCPESDQ